MKELKKRRNKNIEKKERKKQANGRHAQHKQFSPKDIINTAPAVKMRMMPSYFHCNHLAITFPERRLQHNTEKGRSTQATSGILLSKIPQPQEVFYHIPLITYRHILLLHRSVWNLYNWSIQRWWSLSRIGISLSCRGIHEISAIHWSIQGWRSISPKPIPVLHTRPRNPCNSPINTRSIKNVTAPL